jgi:hypothetical protein
MAEYISQRQRFSPRTKLSKYLLKFSKYLLISARTGVSGAAAGGSEGVMPERANLLALVFFAWTLAVLVLLDFNTMAFGATECLDSPDLRIAQPGHWYYYSDRTQNRKCWYFQPAEVRAPEATANAPAFAPATSRVEDSEQSPLSRFARDFVQSFHSQPTQSVYSQPQQREAQQNTVANNSVEATQTISPRLAKPNRTARWERPQITPPPATNGAAIGDQRDPPQRPVAEKNEKRDPPPNVADREALFQDFVKWQMERQVFGRP